MCLGFICSPYLPKEFHCEALDKRAWRPLSAQQAHVKCEMSSSFGFFVCNFLREIGCVRVGEQW